MKKDKLSGRKMSLDKDFRLTPKQKEVLKYLAKGFQNKEIASQMNLSVSTIKLHVSGVILRLNVKTRTAAVVRAQELKII
ncbi:MAG: response regulator transcription factor [Alphaproteobacteria bacterium]|nr:response regulator transcription factor [Alphaproteobacteria bacterium]